MRAREKGPRMAGLLPVSVGSRANGHRLDEAGWRCPASCRYPADIADERNKWLGLHEQLDTLALRAKLAELELDDLAVWQRNIGHRRSVSGT